MKHRHLIALAGAAAMIAAPCAFATPTVSIVQNTSASFLVANQLQSVVISITGFDAGTAIRGIKGTVAEPWIVLNANMSGGFFNINSVNDPDPKFPPLFVDGLYAAPSNTFLNQITGGAAQWDSGLLGSLSAQPNPSILGVPTDCDPDDDIGGFALFTDQSSDFLIAPASWMSTAPGGFPVGPTVTFRVMRLTWTANAQLYCSFVLEMTNGQEFTFAGLMGGPLTADGACCLPSGDCLAWRSQFQCGQQGGTWHPNQPCGSCSSPVGACCVGDFCLHTTEPDCAATGNGEWLGEGSVCGPSSCQPGTPCVADLSPGCGDNVVNVADLLALISAWGACGNPNDCPADIAPAGGDDTVNVADLLAVISAWGACPP